jgi:peptidyl-prolyl cis-trans isomerase D
MLDILRKNAKNVVTYVLFGIIIVVFVVSFGPGSRGCTDARVSGPSWAAKVNGEEVPGTDFEQHYQALFRTYASRGLTRELAEQLGLRRMALDQLVEGALLRQEGARLGITLTNEELEKAIVQNPAFQVDGHFNKDGYVQAVTNAYGAPERYEEWLRRLLVARKVESLVSGSAPVSDDEVRQAYESEGDRANLEFVRFPVSALRAGLQVGPEQVKAFQAKQAARIEAFYKENPARFDKKKRVRARHILFRAADKAPPAEDEAARKKAADALSRAEKGENFEKLARELSEDPGSREQGGDLGFFGPGVMAKPFEEAAFATAPGKLAGPVRSPFGWHVIQVAEVQEPQVVPLEKAAPEIARELLEGDQAKAAAGKQAAEALAKLRTGKSFAEVFPPEPDPKAEKKGPAPVKLGAVVLRPDETGPFGPSQKPNVPRLGAQADLFADAMAATAPALLPKVYETAAGPVVARVSERTRPDAAQFEARRAEVEGRLRAQRGAQIEQAWMKAAREKAKIQINEAFVRGEVTRPPVQLD